MAVLLAEFYAKFNTPCFGIYLLEKPTLVIRAPELIKTILVKDFRYFCDRSVMYNEEIDIIASNVLFALKNPEWKYVRAKVSPLFTTAKLKSMFTLINNVGSDMISYIHKHRNNFVECKELSAKYSTSIIASCAFGINARCFDSENAEFRSITRKMFGYSWKTTFSQFCYFMGHSLVKIFKLTFMDVEVYTFLKKMFWETISERERSKIQQHDLVQVLKDFIDQPDLTETYKLVGDRLLAQAVQFFLAGFETIGSTISFALYELSINPDVQEKLRKEIKDYLLKYKEINFKPLQEMEYLSMVVDETLRKYPAVPFIQRKCTADYKIPNEGYLIEKGTPIFIPLLALHFDPQYFPNPEAFYPERFLDANIKASFTYLPFGKGLRNCIGGNLGLLSAKMCLFSILSRFKIEATSNTPTAIKMSTKSIFLTSKVGIPLKFSEINVFE